MIKTIPIQKVRTSLGEIVNEANYMNRTFLVIRKGKPVLEITRPRRTASSEDKEKPWMKLAGSLPREDGERMKRLIYAQRKLPARGFTKIADFGDVDAKKEEDVTAKFMQFAGILKDIDPRPMKKAIREARKRSARPVPIV